MEIETNVLQTELYIKLINKAKQFLHNNKQQNNSEEVLKKLNCNQWLKN